MKSEALLKFIGGGETNIQDGEEMPVPFTIADELDVRDFRQFFEEKYQNPLDEADLPRLLANLAWPTPGFPGARCAAIPGIGSGILRSLKAWPHIEFVNDKVREEFTVVIRRPVSAKK